MTSQPTALQALEHARLLGLSSTEARMLLLHALGRSRHDRAWLIAHDTDPLPSDASERFQTMCARRLDGEPIAYLVGYKAFHGLELAVDARVLDPRDELPEPGRHADAPDQHGATEAEIAVREEPTEEGLPRASRQLQSHLLLLPIGRVPVTEQVTLMRPQAVRSRVRWGQLPVQRLRVNWGRSPAGFTRERQRSGPLRVLFGLILPGAADVRSTGDPCRWPDNGAPGRACGAVSGRG